MITIEKEITLDKNILLNISDKVSLKNTIILDIETTGLSKDKNKIFLIGCIYYSKKGFKLIQWLCEKNEDEYELLYKFRKFIEDFTYIVTYNGASFDIPFILKRTKLFNIPSSLNQKTIIDLYVDIKPYNKYLRLENLKLVSLEKYYNINRIDFYSGHTLISIYKKFIVLNEYSTSQLLLRHNEDDLLGLYSCLQSYNIINFFKSSPKITSFNYTIEDKLLSYKIPYHCNFDFNFKSNLFTIKFSKDEIIIDLPIYEGELKYYIKDYKNYYYLPFEDTIIHKSVGKFLDKKYRKPANKHNCYIRKRGKFIPLFGTIDTKVFCIDLKSNSHYIELEQIKTNEVSIKLCNNLISNL